MWKRRIADLLDMHREERRGVLVLMAILLVLTGWVIYEQWLRPPKEHDLSAQRARIEAWVASRPEARPAPRQRLFPFDPNRLDRAEWRLLGLSDRQIDGLERYRGKGGRFRSKKDLARMYSIRPGQYDTLEPYILLPDTLARKQGWTGRQAGWNGRRDTSWTRSSTMPERGRKNRAPAPLVEINSADTSALIALPGIGPAYARGIINFRESLGGFRSLDQLAEVYLLKDRPDVVQGLKAMLLLDTLAIKRIPINACTVDQLAAHPYARWRIARPLIAYRSQHGPFQQVSAIRGCAVIDEAVFRKLAPYLTVE